MGAQLSKDDFFDIETVQPSQAQVDKNYQEYISGDGIKFVDRCFLCSRGLSQDGYNKGRWVHYTVNGTIVKADIDFKDESSGGDGMGWFIVGAGCAKKIPSGFAADKPRY